MASFSKEEEKRMNKEPKKSYTANNARNRCMYSKALSTGLLDNAPTKEYLINAIDKDAAFNVDQEDRMIAKITLSRNKLVESPDDGENGTD